MGAAAMSLMEDDNTTIVIRFPVKTQGCAFHQQVKALVDQGLVCRALLIDLDQERGGLEAAQGVFVGVIASLPFWAALALLLIGTSRF